MSNLRPADQMFLERILEMGGGYVLNFSNRTFDDFIRGSTGEEVYSDRYDGHGDSKANRIRSFFANASNGKVAILLGDLLTLMIDNENIAPDGADAQRVKEIIIGLMGSAPDSKATRRADAANPLATPRRAFVSYSVERKEAGGAVKQYLSEFGYECFLAHTDLQVSEEWKHRILEELGAADVFVALLSEEFRSSNWCSQELGFIVSRPEVLIVPLSLDGTTPFGFIEHLQGTKVTKNSLRDVLEEVMFRKRPRQMIHPQIDKIRHAGSYRYAESLVALLAPHFSRFSSEEANEFALAAADNGEVWDAALCVREYLPRFAELAGGLLSPEARSALLEVRPELEFPAG